MKIKCFLSTLSLHDVKMRIYKSEPSVSKEIMKWSLHAMNLESCPVSAKFPFLSLNSVINREIFFVCMKEKLYFKTNQFISLFVKRDCWNNARESYLKVF